MLLALLVTLAAATPDAAPPTTAAPPAAVAATAPAAKKPAADEMVCKSETVVGSLLPRKTCRRKSEADAARADQQAQVRENQRSLTGPSH
jgi:hypothetical protein